jgi:hypothetical protein
LESPEYNANARSAQLPGLVTGVNCALHQTPSKGDGFMLRALFFGLAIAAVPVISGCASQPPKDPNGRAMDPVAEDYVKLVLAMGELDPGYVDAYYGPADWQKAVAAQHWSPEVIAARAESARTRLAALDEDDAPAVVQDRKAFLDKQLEALIAYAKLLGGSEMTFDEQAKKLYDATPPHYSADHFRTILAQLDKLLPGTGDLATRYANYRKHFVIPTSRLDDVFDAAINEARQRTHQHIHLPPQERFKVEYVTDKPWSGYNWYKGDAYSVIQINTDLPIHIERAIDLAAHEGYPGHHVYNTLLEQHMVRQRGWVEFSVYPLYSPQSLIAEGSANFGVDVAFPGASRLAFDHGVLFPLAGLDPATAQRYLQIRDRVRQLSYAINEAARGYVDGTMTHDQIIHWLETYALKSPAEARHSLRFIEKYRAYVINYNYGQDLVRHYVNDQGGTADRPEKRWEVFADLLSAPRTPSMLR